MLMRKEVTVANFMAYLTASGKAEGYERHCVVRWGSSQKIVTVTAPHVFAALSIEPPADINKHPAVCITVEDARAYAKWLSNLAGTAASFRLPTEIEWEFAAKPSNGNGPAPPTEDYSLCSILNVADRRFSELTSSNAVLRQLRRPNRNSAIAGCTDTSPLTEAADRRMPTNPHGLINILGNVAELTNSCWTTSSGHTNSNCDRLVVRGGSFASFAGNMTTWRRGYIKTRKDSAQVGYFDVGLRLARISGSNSN